MKHLRREKLRTEFLEIRSKMQDIYQSWDVSSCDQVSRTCSSQFLPFFSPLCQPSLVVSQQALNTFLSRPFAKCTEGLIDHADQTGCSGNGQTNLNGVNSNGSETSMQKLASPTEGAISVEEILCPHRKLDPGKAVHMKRIDRVRLGCAFLYLIDDQNHIGCLRIVHTGIWCIVRSNTRADRHLPYMCGRHLPWLVHHTPILESS
jgi:hypothetical protein